MTTYLSQQQQADFERDGFLVVADVLDTNTLTAIRTAMAARIKYLLQRYQQNGRGNGSNGQFDDDMTHLLQIAPEAYQHIDISLPMLHDMAVRVADWQAIFGDDWHTQAGIYTDDSVYQLITHPNIVAIATQLLGEEVIASPVQHVRIKPPQHLLSGSAAIDANTARTLWHQDEAVVSEEARGVDILTAWVAISDANLKNGCMLAVAGSHKTSDDSNKPDFGLTTHCPGKGKLVGEIYIPDKDINKDNTVPLIANAGDVVLLNKRCIHGAGANTSTGVRWSFDMRYQPANTPSGRNCFPSTPVASRSAPHTVVQNAQQYRASWLAARDAIISGKTEAIFNSRWNKYAPLCA